MDIDAVENKQAGITALAVRQIEILNDFDDGQFDTDAERMPRGFRKARHAIVNEAVQLAYLMENNRFGKSGFHDSALYKRIIATPNLCAAWREFKNDKTNKKDVLEFAERAEEHFVALHDDLASGTYRHGPYSRFFVHDPKQRPIAKAGVRDRVLHHAICRILGPIFDKRFIFDSYASRKTKGTHAANERLREFARKLSHNNTQAVWLLKCDIRKFFDSVDHEILLELCDARITDRQVLGLLRMIVTSFETRVGKGIPLGNLTSQLLANVYLDQLDQYIKRELRCKWYVRYTDDFVMLSNNRHELEEILPKIREFLHDRLQVDIHPNKIVFRKWHQGFDFLGYVHFPHHKLVRTKTVRRMFRKLAIRHAGAEDDTSQGKLEQAKQSYLGILSHARGKKFARDIRHTFRKTAKSDLHTI